MKLRKRFAAIGAAMIMTIGVLGIEASASGNVYYSTAESTSTKVVYKYTNVSNGNGATSSTKFYATSTGAHTVSFTPNSSGETYIRLVCSDSGKTVYITVPKAVPAMPSTLSSSYTLYKKTNSNPYDYSTKVIASTSTNISGSVSIDGAKKN